VKLRRVDLRPQFHLLMNSQAQAHLRLSPAAAHSIPFAIYVGFLVVESLAAGVAPGGQSTFDWRWLYAVKVGCVALALALLWGRYTELVSHRWPSLKATLLACGAGLLVLVLWVNLTMPWVTLGTSDGFDPRTTTGEPNWPLIVVRTLGAVLVVPLMEELFWRSFIMRWLEQAYFLTVAPASVGLRALLISSIMFGFEHSLWLAGVLAGLVYGWLYVRSRSLWVPVLAHAITNGGLAIWVVVTQRWQFW
jgi:uncharacterized protein